MNVCGYELGHAALHAHADNHGHAGLVKDIHAQHAAALDERAEIVLDVHVGHYVVGLDAHAVQYVRVGYKMNEDYLILLFPWA
ncbi:MAG: hypothetical protein P4L79_15815 [Legionella sp.]|uniref:hypothetical protein n=1 Tax=Legionella sp. TaxID=459 RepID=UPI00284ED2F4|nr:hypothetical protein [Legionella sp.]